MKEIQIPLGFIYYLQNPTTGEIFYIGATEASLKNRLRTHYQHLREVDRGLRKTNNRYNYLFNLKPLKATIHLLEIVTEGNLWEREKFYIKNFRELNPNLTNMTDGGPGNNTYKYQTDKNKQVIGLKISQKLKGKKKPRGFAENMSKKRQGINNPAAKELKNWIVADNKYLFKYGFEINNFIESKHAYGNVHRQIKLKNRKPYGYKWEYFSNIDIGLQDIVHTTYESKMKIGKEVLLNKLS